MTSKRLLREPAKARRAALARAIPDFAVRAAKWADQLSIPAGALVAGYIPLRDEADPLLLMRTIGARGHRLALPCVDRTSKELAFRAWSEGDATVVNAYGIAEPAAQSEVVEPGIILVPLLAFDRLGHRLGYGGGYYDRLLARVAATAIGVAYSGQEVKELPHEPHDRALAQLVTETGVRSFG